MTNDMPTPSITKTGRRWPLILIFGVIAILVFIQATLLLLTGWLNASAGQRWLQTKLTTATGLQVSFDRLTVVGISEVAVNQLRMADQQGVFATVNKAGIDIQLGALLQRRAAFNLHADRLELTRLPVSTSTAPKRSGPPLTPMSPPRIYVRSASLGLSISQLILSQKIVGRPLTLSPTLQFQTQFGGPLFTAHLNGHLKPQQTDAHDDDLYIPHYLLLDATLDPKTDILTIAKGDIAAAVYNLTFNGTAGLGIQDTIAINLRLHSDDLARLTGTTLNGNLDLKTILSATLPHPAIEIAGNVDSPELVKKEIGSLTLQAQAADFIQSPHGAARLSTSYQRQPAELALKFDQQDDNLRIHDIAGTAPGVKLDGTVTLDKTSTLADGQLHAAVNLSAYQDLLNGLAGEGDARLMLTPKAGKQAAALTAAVKDLQRGELSLQTATLTAQMADLKSGQLPQLVIAARGLLAPNAQINRLNATITPVDAQNFQLQGTAAGQGHLPFSLTMAAAVQGNAKSWSARDINLQLASKPGTLTVRGLLDQHAAALNLAAMNFALGALPGLPPAAAKLALSGKTQLTGTMQTPQISSDMTVRPAAQRAGAKSSIAIRLQTTVTDGVLHAALKGSGTGITRLAGDIALPLHLSLEPFAFQLPADTALKGALTVDARLDKLSHDFLPPDLGLGGNLQALLTAAGTVGTPKLQGNIALTDGTLRQESTGLLLQRIALRSSFQDKLIKLASLQAQDGAQGSLSASGTIDLGAAMPLNLKLTADHLNPLRNSNFFSGQLSTSLMLTGRQPHYDLKGRIMAQPVSITIPDRFGSKIPQLNIVKPNREKPGVNFLQAINLAIRLDAPNQFFVRGWGLDAEFGGKLDVGGTLAAPDVNGSLSSKRGRFEQFGKRFDISSGTLRFEGAIPPSPYLDITSTTTTNGITAQIDLTGPVTQPALKLSAVPALPQDEVLSRILFGKDMSNISPFQAIQIAQTLQQFSGKGNGGGSDPIAKLRGATGLDDLSVNSSDTGPTTVGAGKYLTDRVYLSVQSGADEKSNNAQIQIDLTRHLKAQSKVGAEAQTGGGLLWQWDY